MSNQLPKALGSAGHRLALVALLAAGACAPSDQAQAAQTREHEEQRTEASSLPLDQRMETAAPDTSWARSLSAAFRAAANTTLPSVVYVGVEREAQMADASPQMPDLFRRFFEFEGPGIPEGPAPPREGSGSGFVFDDEGRILTNHHVVDGATRIVVRTLEGREFEAEVVGSDPSTDIAILELDLGGQTLPPAPLGDSDDLLIGDWVLALGNPLGLEFTVTSGIVSAKGRQLTNRQLAVESYIQTDAAINPGNSGGPLVDLSGRVVGINTAIFGGQRFVGYGFAVPISLAREVASDLLAYGYARRPRLGVGVNDVTAVDAEVYGLDEVRGAEVVTVDEDSPSGGRLEVGDVILGLDGRPINNANDLIAALARMDPGDEVSLEVVRDGRAREVRVELGEFEHEESQRRVSSRDEDVDELLGFSVGPLTRELARRLQIDDADGIVVTGVRDYGPAARAGLRPGQRVVGVNGRRVDDMADFEAAIEGIEAGDVVSLRVVVPDVGETIFNFRVRGR